MLPTFSTDSDLTNMDIKLKHTPLILDGGMSRELIRLKAPFKQPEWSALSLIEAPHLVAQVHRDFIQAGADVITTNSYAIVPFHLGEERFWQRGKELAALAGSLARKTADTEYAATGRRILVAGSLPPIFGSYEPDEFDSETVHRYLNVLVEALTPYVDVWLAETLSLLAEADAAYAATRGTGKPFWVAFTPDDSSEAHQAQPRLRSGQSINQVVEWASTTQVDALLFNCARPEFMAAPIEKAITLRSNQSTDARTLIGVYANSFVPRANDYAANENVASTDANLDEDVYSKFASEWIANGVDIVGGCCGIGHDHVRKIADHCRLLTAKSR